jgi:phosphoribosylaminoimidazole-succinocarboxamide synthase
LADVDRIDRKVRDIYDFGDQLVIVATDRISAFDYVLGSGIPDKGKMLSQMSVFWFGRTGGIVANHLLSNDPGDYPAEAREAAELLRGRSMLVRRAEPLPIECVARGYLSGSGWKDYVATARSAATDCQPDCASPIACPIRFSRRPPRPRAATTSTSTKPRRSRWWAGRSSTGCAI